VLLVPPSVVLGLSLQRRQAAADTAREFLETLHQDDPGAFKALLTREAAEQSSLWHYPLFYLRQARGTYRVEDPSFRGNAATVAVNGVNLGAGSRVGLDGEHTAVLEMFWEDGRWRVDSLRLVSDGRVWLTTLPPTPPSERTRNPGTRTPAREIGEVGQILDRDQFDAAWRTTLDVSDRPAQTVLQPLADSLHLSLNTAVSRSLGEPAPLTRAVSLKVSGCSRLEAIEEVCRRLDLYPQYSSGTLSFGHGPRPWPVGFAGPFLIEVEDFKEYPQYARGILQLKLLAAGLPMPLVGPIRATFRVRDAQGHNLFHSATDAASTFPFRPASPDWDRTGSTVQSLWRVSLKNLLRSVSSVDTFEGQIHLKLPTKLETLSFDSFAPGSRQQAGDKQLTIVQAFPVAAPHSGPPSNAPLVSTVEFECKELADTTLRFIAYDEEGQVLDRNCAQLPVGGPAQVKGVGGLATGVSGRKLGHVQVVVPAAARSLRVLLFSGGKEAVYPFLVRKIPLPARPPEQLEPVQFAGHPAPATVKCVGSTNGTAGRVSSAQLRVTNHSDKDIEAISLKLIFLDAQGKALGEARLTQAGTDPSLPQLLGKERSPFPVLVARKATTEFGRSGAFPAETRSIRVELRRVVFVDASTWQP
jgi:hypothetical protein